MRVLGIDPGYDRCGIAILEGKRDKPTLCYSSCVQTDPKTDFLARIGQVCDEIERVITAYHPDVLAIEEVFFSKNQKTALHVATTRGAIIHVAHANRIPVAEYNPQTIKIAITGYGKADKGQIFTMIRKLVAVPDEEKRDDEYDAIAVGVTHLAHART